MKRNFSRKDQASVLITALLTITILTMICATSLYVTSQTANAGMQTASWHQSLTGAESGVDAAVRALNTGIWTDWKTVNSSTLPTVEPTPGGTDAAVRPSSTQYNWLPSSALTVSFPGSEGATSISSWVTIDTAGMSAAQDTNGKQWYRVRATGQAAVSGPARVSANKLDNALRNTIGLKFNRKGGSVLGPTRTIEVIMQALTTSDWGRGLTLKNWLSMSGGGTLDSFDSSSPFKSTSHLFDAAKRQNHGDIGMNNSSGSDLRGTYVYGNLSYSGPAVKNTSHVQGTISTPFSVAIPGTSAPSGWASYTTYSSGNPGTLAAGSKTAPTYYKINGDVTVSGGQTLLVQQYDNNADNQIYVWVSGKLTTSGNGVISQDTNVKITWYVGGEITVSGDSYNNKSGYASNVAIVGYGNNKKATISGDGDFIGTLDAPGYDVTVSGSGSFIGALIADTLTISGGAGLHYDESLGNGGAGSPVGNYAFASWFEDNSDTARGIIY
jgi:hypothetical protein